jgi:hypothetical protein
VAHADHFWLRATHCPHRVRVADANMINEVLVSCLEECRNIE